MKVCVVTTGDVGEALLKALADAGQITVMRAPDVTPTQPHTTCSVCREVTQASYEDDARFEGPACVICRSVADRIERRFDEGARRHWREFRGQLPQMVRDIRGGADEPTFYRGFEG